MDIKKIIEMIENYFQLHSISTFFVLWPYVSLFLQQLVNLKVVYHLSYIKIFLPKNFVRNSSFYLSCLICPIFRQMVGENLFEVRLTKPKQERVTKTH